MIKVAVLDDYQNSFKEKFQLFHFIGATFIISGIYLSNRKTND